MDPAELVREASFPFALGCVVRPARALVAAIEAAGSRGAKWFLYSSLRGLVAGAAPLTADIERRTLRELFGALADGPPFEKEREALLALLRVAPSASQPSPGSALALAVSSRHFLGEPFGVARPLVVQVKYREEVSRIKNKAGDEALYREFQHGVDAALELVLRHGPRALAFAQLIHSYSFVGEMQGLPEHIAVEGPSMGLAAAVAVVSELTGIAVDPAYAFTGSADVKGAIGRVTGIPHKLAAAQEKGARLVFLPACNVNDVPGDLARSMDIRFVERVEPVIYEVLGRERVRESSDRLYQRYLKKPAGDTVKPQRWIVGAEEPMQTRRILLTFVGKADPEGRYLGHNRAPVSPLSAEARGVEEREGPTLATVRMLRPHAVYLLHTIMPEENDLRENMLATKRFLERGDPDLGVHPVPLEALRDPSDYEQVVPAVRRAVEAIKAREAGPDVRWFVNVSSGTPTMESTWHLLREWRLLDATLLQAREARHLTTEGEPRIREVVFPVPA